MNISVCIPALKYHRGLLAKELDEVNVLFSILEGWKAQGDISTFSDPNYLFEQEVFLERQKRWIMNRINVLDVFIGEFSSCQAMLQNIWEDSGREVWNLCE